ncbi:hypothetical protein [Macrococcus armenti]|uniref:hypothetical protein n=1 Tax=Macrococcus armenti TaxID=2875764 RepID=UPI001CCD6EDF|nr:hypothetical protein [Macrococcus armenti]UBH13103.1 hypothetical protein LAU43_11485 [Macrococcus armenti]
MKCNKCNSVVGSEDLFCGECGNDLRVQRAEMQGNAAPQNENKTYEPKKEQVIHNTQSTPESQQQMQQVPPAQQYQQQSAPIINKEQVNEQSKALVNEGKGFFRQAFSAHDDEIANNHFFSLALNGILVAAGLVIIGILLSIATPDDVSMLGASKSDVAMTFVISGFVIVALVFTFKFLLSKFLINPSLTFAKSFSDFVVVNTYSVCVIVFAMLLIVIGSYGFGMIILTLGTILILFSPVYFFGKYSSLYKSSVPSFLIVVIYAVLLLISFGIFAEKIGNSVLSSFYSIF